MGYKDKAVTSLISALDDEACTGPNLRLEAMLVGVYHDGTEYFRLEDESGVKIKTIDDLIPHLKLTDMTLRFPSMNATANHPYGSSRTIMIANKLKFTIHEMKSEDQWLRDDYGTGEFRLGFITGYFNDNDTKTRLKIISPNLHKIGGMMK